MTRAISRLAPKSLRRSFNALAEMRQLRAVPAAPFETGRLRAANELDLENIFDSDSVEDLWKSWDERLQQLEIPDNASGVNPGDRRALFYLVAFFGARSVLEIGTNIGASTVHLAGGLHAGGAHSDGALKLVTVDIVDVNYEASQPWRAQGIAHSPRAMITALGLGHRVEFVARPALEYLSDCRETFDLIFLDGDHAAPSVYREVSAALALLNPKGLIILHDYFPGLRPLWSNGSVIRGPFVAAERMRKEGAGVCVLPLGSLPWPTKLNSIVTSLALLLREAA